MNFGFIYMIKYSNGIYIGSTINLKQRQYQHRTKEKSKVILEELDKVNISELFYWENFYIELLISFGFNILNKQKINIDSMPYSERTNEKMLLRRKIEEEKNKYCKLFPFIIQTQTI